MCLEESSKASIIAKTTSYPSLAAHKAAKEKRSYTSRKTIQRRSENFALPPSIGLILLLCFILHGPISWLSSSESKNRVWDFFPCEPISCQQLASQPAAQQQTKTILNYDFASGSLVYCNGDPVNGLDPDGRCKEGASAGWANGNRQFVGTYDSSQASSQLAYRLGWTVGAVLGDVNATVARSVAYAAALSLYGLNTAVESTENFLGGPGARGAFGFMAPLMALEMEAAASTTAIEESTAPRILTEAEKSIYGRVSRPKGFHEQVWERAKAVDDNVYDPNGRILKYNEPWELGHKPNHKFSNAQKRAVEEEWDRETWRKYQNDPDIYRPELPSSNSSHNWE